MPPWLPEKGYGEFEGERRLNDYDLALLQKWVATGAMEGDPADLPAIPKWNNGWQLGEPDLIVETAPYTLPADGKDVYYNFVVPIPTTSNRYVSGVEFLPGVHHKNITPHDISICPRARTAYLLVREPYDRNRGLRAKLRRIIDNASA